MAISDEESAALDEARLAVLKMVKKAADSDQAAAALSYAEAYDLLKGIRFPVPGLKKPKAERKGVWD